MQANLSYIVEGFPPLQVLEAKTFLQRFLGLMGRKKIPRNEGLLIYPCNSIHMCFMRFAIDAVYFSKDGTILKVVKNLRPWLGMSMCFKAFAVLEINAGTSEKYGLLVGKKPLVSQISK